MNKRAKRISIQTIYEAEVRLLRDPSYQVPEHLKAIMAERARAEEERSIWEMPVSPERLRRWNELEKAGARQEVWSDQAKLFEEWLEQHPERVEDLVSWYGRTQKETPILYHWSGLYWLAANVAFKRFGFGDDLRDAVGHAVFDRLYAIFNGNNTRQFNKLPEDRREELNAAFGQAMHEAHQKLSKKGADAIQNFEHWLAHSAKRILKGGRIVNPELRKRQRRKKKTEPSETADELTSVDLSYESEHSDLTSTDLLPEEDLLQEVLEVLDDGEGDEHSLPYRGRDQVERSDIDTLAPVELAEFISTLSDQQKAVFSRLLINPYLSNSDLAPDFGLTPQRIGQIRSEIERCWNHR